MVSFGLVAASFALCVGCLLLPFTAWMTHHILEFVKSLQERARASSTIQSDQRGAKGLRFTLLTTKITSICFTLGQIFGIAFTALLLIRYISRGADDNKKVIKGQNLSNPLDITVVGIYAINSSAVRPLFILILCERMRLSFAGTRHALSESTVRWFRAGIAMAALLTVMKMALYSVDKLAISATLVLLDCLLYTAISLGLSWSFFRKSKMITDAQLRSAIHTTRFSTVSLENGNSNNPNNSNNDNNKIKKHNISNNNYSGSSQLPLTNQVSESRSRTVGGSFVSHPHVLIDAGLRIASVSVLGIVSTVIADLSFAIVFAFTNEELIWFAVALGRLDYLVNNYVLLCTFKDGLRWYRPIMGKWHDYCMSLLVDQPQ